MSNLAHVKLDSHMPLTYLGLVVYVNVYGRHIIYPRYSPLACREAGNQCLGQIMCRR